MINEIIDGFSFENKNIRMHTIISRLHNIVLRILDDSWR